MLAGMSSPEKIRGAVSLASNSPFSATGYGVQAGYLVERMKRHGLEVAALSNYGLEGAFDTISTKHGNVKHYPKGFKPYSDDVIPLWHQEFTKDFPHLKNAVMTLYDIWVYKNMKFEGDIIAYVPIDHVTMPPMVEAMLRRKNITPVTMSLHGQKMLEARGISSTYCPHSVDTSVFMPTHEINGVPTRQFMGVKDDDFLVSIVAANKSNGIVHRKALAEQIMAFSVLRQKVKNAKLYLHMEPSAAFGGFDIPALVSSVGLDDTTVIVADSTQLRIGYPQGHLAALYTASDVLMNATLGEGFGVTTVEAQACGTRVITSSWTASQDLAGPESWLIDGQPFWDEPQKAWYNTPLIGSLVSALELAHKAPRGISIDTIKFAKQYDVEKVWDKYWLPFFRGFFA